MKTGLLTGGLAVLLITGAALAQTPSHNPAHNPAHDPPMTSWGAPDLEGVWTNASVTKLTRMPGVERLVLTPEEARRIEQSDFNNARTEAERQPTDQSAGAPERGKPLPSVGNYNAVWVDPGSRIAVVNGELRSSWITDPPSGQIPMSDAGRGLMASARPAYNPGTGAEISTSVRPQARDPRAGPPEQAPLLARPFVDGVEAPRAAPGGQAAANYIGPESRGLGERCIVLRMSGPVMANGLYNNNFQIVQSPGTVAIVVEMVHDARIIPVVSNAAEASTRFRPPGLNLWMGDSVGWYEGATLVVETRNFHPQQATQVYISEAGRLTERFTRVSVDEILYEFIVDDPQVYTQVWRGETSWLRNPEGMYEFACHEGNYGLLNILKGARELERRGIMLDGMETEE